MKREVFLHNSSILHWLITPTNQPTNQPTGKCKNYTKFLGLLSFANYRVAISLESFRPNKCRSCKCRRLPGGFVLL